jgi:tetratricopeptide (TPR) repeat protein
MMGDGIGAAYTLSLMATVARGAQDVERAFALVDESLALLRRLGDKRAILQLLTQLGYWFQIDYARARVWTQEAVALARDLGYRPGLVGALRNWALVELLGGDAARAEALLEESLALAREWGDRLNIAYSAGDLGRVLSNRGELTRAAALLEESLALAKVMGNLVWRAYPLSRLGFVALQGGETEKAAAWFAESLALYKQWSVRWGISECLSGIAGLFTASQPDRAATLLGAIESLRRDVDVPRPPAEQAAHDERVEAARRALPEADFAAAWSRGQALSEAEAVALAQEALGAPAV